MSSPVEPKWPRLLGLAVHELRTPVTVVAGYIRMLLKDRAGALNEQQRRLLEEAEKSCGRLSALIAEMSDLSNLEAGTTTFNRGVVNLDLLLADTVAALPGVPDREVRVALATDGAEAKVQGDSGRLKTAFISIINALRRELISSDELCVRERQRQQQDGNTVAWIAIGDPGRIDTLMEAEAEALTVFDEWRGGCGLSLAVARRIIEQHGGRLWSPAVDPKAGAVAMLPLEP